jgi:hypothetical protein
MKFNINIPNKNLQFYANNIGKEIPFKYDGLETTCTVLSIKDNQITLKVIDEKIAEKFIQKICISEDRISVGIAKTIDTKGTLKPCPFCGSEATPIYCEPECCGGELRIIECTNKACGCTLWCSSFDDWNKRYRGE